MRRVPNREIVFVAGLHGNEKKPVEALRSRGIPFILGNPRAGRKNSRFIDRDLNASFGLHSRVYEAKRAAEILDKIGVQNLVVDFHTTVAKTPPFAIVVDDKMIPFAATAGVKHVVHMRILKSIRKDSFRCLPARSRIIFMGSRRSY